MRVLALLVFFLGSISTAFGQSDPRRFEQMLKSDDPAHLTSEIEEIKANAGHIDPVMLMLMASRLHQLGKNDDALFWFYAGQLRMRSVQSIAPSETRGQALASLMFSIGPVVHEHVRQEPGKVAEVIDRVIAWDESTPFDLQWLQRKPSVAQSEWSAIRMNVRRGLADLKRRFAEMRPGADECGEYRSDHKPDAVWTSAENADRIKRGLSDDPVTVVSNGMKFRFPMNYWTPYGGARDADIQNRALQVVVFWPELKGYTHENWRERPGGGYMPVYVVPSDPLPSTVQRKAANAVPRDSLHGLDAYPDPEAQKCFPADVLIGRGASGNEEAYLRCSIDRDTKLYSFCNLSFYGRSGYVIVVTVRSELLPQWREIKTRISELIESWLIAARQ